MTAPEDMLAATLDRYGPAQSIALRRMPVPVPQRGQLLLRVLASSLNPIDSKLRAGALRPFLRLKFPAVLGFDLAGEVAALGPEVTGWAVGERAYGRIERLTGGAHAQFAVVSASVLDRIPERFSFEEAAGLPLTGMTALMALRDLAHVGPGQRLLVHGAAGGVGVSAVQIGRALGAEVTGTCGSSSKGLVQSLGAMTALDYASELSAHQETYDVLFDTQYKQPYSKLAHLLRSPGVYVTTGFSPGLALRKVMAGLSRKKIHWVMSGPSAERMRALSAMVGAGELKPVIDSVFPLERIAEAYEKLETGHAHGKVVLTLA